MGSARPPAPVLFAAEFEWDSELIALTILLVSMVGLGVAATVWAKRWRKAAEEPENAEELVEHYEALIDEGLLDPAELERIRACLETQAPPAEPDRLPSDRTALEPGPPPTRGPEDSHAD